MIWLNYKQLKIDMHIVGFETDERYYFAPSGGMVVARIDSHHVYIRHPHGDMELLPLTTRFLYKREKGEFVV